MLWFTRNELVFIFLMTSFFIWSQSSKMLPSDLNSYHLPLLPLLCHSVLCVISRTVLADCYLRTFALTILFTWNSAPEKSHVAYSLPSCLFSNVLPHSLHASFQMFLHSRGLFWPHHMKSTFHPRTTISLCPPLFSTILLGWACDPGQVTETQFYNFC